MELLNCLQPPSRIKSLEMFDQFSYLVEAEALNSSWQVTLEGQRVRLQQLEAGRTAQRFAKGPGLGVNS